MNLKLKDAPLMLEWMHDESVVHDLNQKFSEKTITDCEKFIQMSMEQRNQIHLAIVDDFDIYMGTVSLKDINKENGSAEFAITVRSIAMGKGYSYYAMSKIFEMGFSEFDLICIYWYVSENNIRAVKFYEKHNYKQVKIEHLIRRNVCINIENENKMIWYCIEKDREY